MKDLESNTVKLIKQKTPTTCGQCCVAMIMACSIDHAIKLIGHDGITSDEEILKAIGNKGPFINGVPPKDIVALQKHKEPNGDRAHWTISYYGEILDPACIGPKLWGVSTYVETPISDRVNCLFCDQEMEEATPDGFKTYQPYFGGEVQFIFSFGSTKFDKCMGSTVYRGFICDDCGAKYVPKMKEIKDATL